MLETHEYPLWNLSKYNSCSVIFKQWMQVNIRIHDWKQKRDIYEGVMSFIARKTATNSH